MNGNSKTQRGKFTFVDLLLLLVILAVVLVLVYVFVSPYTGTITLAPTKNIVYTIQVNDVRSEFKGLITEGDTVTSTSTLREIGKVVSVEYKNVQYTGKDEKGNTVISDYPGLLTAVITVSARANTEDGLYKAGDVTISAGTQIGFRVPKYTAEGYCTLVKEGDD
ncbi:MAG: DUF4330 family protein [Clostridia bacterium]|nr:DUF4330 family protein [Clostridia bacterium]